MVVQNSQVRFYSDLCCSLLTDNPLAISEKEVLRDCDTVRHRVSHEGLGFLTKVLPLIGKALDRALDSGQLSLPPQVKLDKGRKSPAFMRGYFRAVFTEDGRLLEEPSVDAIKHLRQVLFHAYKLSLDYTSAQEAAVIASFVDVEQELEALNYDGETLSLIETASHIMDNIFESFDYKDIAPRHGPGAVATGEKLEEKWVFSRLYSNIHQVYPYYDYYVVGRGRELLDRLGWYKQMERHVSGTAKFVLVPKDSRGPRSISCEPLEYQWIQQGLGRKVMRHLETSLVTRGHVNFTHQTVNQELALSSSKTRKYATLDLKDASDRVSVKLVSKLFSKQPGLLRALLATRTSETQLPNGEKVFLNKFAPMGSALCFPIEAVCFWTICVASIIRKDKVPLRDAGKLVYVYGDDIIVATEYASLVMQALESVGLVVNKQKSCIHGWFRESCGVDAYKGVNVTPFRIKPVMRFSKTDPEAYAAYVAFANHLQGSGYARTCAFIRSELEKIYGSIPFGLPDSPFVCWHAPSASVAEARNKLQFRSRWNASIQRLEFRVKYLVPRRLSSKLDGWNRLLRDMVSPAAGLTDSVVVPRSTNLKRGWKVV